MRALFARKITNLRHALVPAAVLPLLLVPPVAAVGVLERAGREPTIIADRSQLADLANYRVYVGSKSGPCPGPFFFDVSFSTLKPACTGATYVLTGLNASHTCFVQVTTVDTDGNEGRGSIFSFRRGTA